MICFGFEFVCFCWIGCVIRCDLIVKVWCLLYEVIFFVGCLYRLLIVGLFFIYKYFEILGYDVGCMLLVWGGIDCKFKMVCVCVVLVIGCLNLVVILIVWCISVVFDGVNWWWLSWILFFKLVCKCLFVLVVYLFIMICLDFILVVYYGVFGLNSCWMVCI